MESKKLEFNETLWEEILKTSKFFEDKNKKLTAAYLKRQFPFLSERHAACYIFALNNKDAIVPDWSVKNNISAIKTDLYTERKRVKGLLQEINLADQRLSYMFALNHTKGLQESIKVTADPEMKSESTAIALCGDVHAEETVKKEVMNGLNEYNLETFIKRFTRYFSRLLYVIRMQRKAGHEINNLVLTFLGDLITGYIHEELMENNSLSPTEAANILLDLMTSGIKLLANEGAFKKIIIVGIRGNHGRTSHRKKFATGYKNSYEWLMYKRLEKTFKDHLTGYENIEFVIPESEFAYIDIYDKKWGFSHGDHFNYMGGIGGVMVPLMRWLSKINDVIDADMRGIGHWHSYISLPKCLVNGSMIGYAPYALGKAFAPEEPKMQLQLQDKKLGFTVNIPILLDDF